MSKSSRDKGKRGERELAQLFTGEGYPAKRFGFAQSRFGGCEGADVVCEALPWLHVECKRYKTFMGAKLRAALEQAERDQLLEEALETVLDAEEREAVRLRYIQYLSQDDITRVLGLSGTGARALLQRCRRKLRSELLRRLEELGRGPSLFLPGGTD